MLRCFIVSLIIFVGCSKKLLDPANEIRIAIEQFSENNPNDNKLNHTNLRSGVLVIASPHTLNSAFSQLSKLVGEKAAEEIYSASGMKEEYQLYFIDEQRKVYGGTWKKCPLLFNNLFIVAIKSGDLICFEIEKGKLTSVKNSSPGKRAVLSP